MKYIRLLKCLLRKPTVILIMTVALPAQADFERGKGLYENHCQICHDKIVHSRENSKVTSKESLQAWVWSRILHSDVNWEQEEVDDVTEYLNGTFYKFRP